MAITPYKMPTVQLRVAAIGKTRLLPSSIGGDALQDGRTSLTQCVGELDVARCMNLLECCTVGEGLMTQFKCAGR